MFEFLALQKARTHISLLYHLDTEPQSILCNYKRFLMSPCVICQRLEHILPQQYHVYYIKVTLL